MCQHPVSALHSVSSQGPGVTGNLKAKEHLDPLPWAGIPAVTIAWMGRWGQRLTGVTC